MKNNKSTHSKDSYIIPFKERRMIDVVISVIAVLLFAIISALVWLIIANGGSNIVVNVIALSSTAGLVCSLTALITGRMEWLLIGLLTYY